MNANSGSGNGESGANGIGRLMKLSSVIDRLGGMMIGIDGAPLVKPDWWNAIEPYDRTRIKAGVLRYLGGLGWEPPVIFPRTWDDIARWNGMEREHIPPGAGDVQKGW